MCGQPLVQRRNTGIANLRLYYQARVLTSTNASDSKRVFVHANMNATTQPNDVEGPMAVKLGHTLCRHGRMCCGIVNFCRYYQLDLPAPSVMPPSHGSVVSNASGTTCSNTSAGSKWPAITQDGQYFRTFYLSHAQSHAHLCAPHSTCGVSYAHGPSG
eukprot:14402_1